MNAGYHKMWFCSMPCYLYVTNFVDAVNAYVRLGDQSQICTSAATDLGVRGHATGLVNMKKREKDVSLRWPYTFNVCWPAPWGPTRNRREDSALNSRRKSSYQTSFCEKGTKTKLCMSFFDNWQ